MLSNPELESSAGSSSAGSTSRLRRSRTALPYSARLRRCRPTRPGIGVSEIRAIELGFGPGGQAIEGGFIGAGHAGGRHHAAANLLRDFLPKLGVVAEVGGVEFFEDESAGFESLAVAGDAIFVEQGALVCGGWCAGRGWLLRGCGQGEGGDGTQQGCRDSYPFEPRDRHSLNRLSLSDSILITYWRQQGVGAGKIRANWVLMAKTLFGGDGGIEGLSPPYFSDFGFTSFRVFTFSKIGVFGEDGSIGRRKAGVGRAWRISESIVAGGWWGRRVDGL